MERNHFAAQHEGYDCQYLVGRLKLQVASLEEKSPVVHKTIGDLILSSVVRFKILQKPQIMQLQNSLQMAVLRERSAETAEDAAVSSDSEVKFAVISC